MSESEPMWTKAPIVEAVLEIECDLPAGQKLETLESGARSCFRDRYPKFCTQFLHEHHIESKPDQAPEIFSRQDTAAFHFVQEDGKQLVQVRLQGFSFNRLAPYTTLGDYLPEIERTWHLYRGLASPVQIRTIRLRYINRLLLPLSEGSVKLEEYLQVGPQLPDESALTLMGFVNQYTAVEVQTGHQVNVVMTHQVPEHGNLPVIFDNCVSVIETREPEDWAWILDKIQSLRCLKNRIFNQSLTPKCRNLFQ